MFQKWLWQRYLLRESLHILMSGDAPWQMILSLVLGTVVAIAYKFDLPKYLNMESNVPYVGCILTGILISRGANYIYDLLTKINVMH